MTDERHSVIDPYPYPRPDEKPAPVDPWFPEFLYGKVSTGISCPACKQADSTSLDVLCRRCWGPLVRPSNLLTRIVQNIWFLRLLPLPTVFLTVVLYNVWPLYFFLSFLSFLFFSLFLRNHKRQLAYFLLLGSLVFLAGAVSIFRTSGGQSLGIYSIGPSLVRLLIDICRTVVMELWPSAPLELLTLDSRYVGIQGALLLGLLFSLVYITRTHGWQKAMVVTGMSSSLGLLLMAVLWWGGGHPMQAGLYARYFVPLTLFWIGLTVTLALAREISRVRRPIPFELPLLEKWKVEWEVLEVPPESGQLDPISRFLALIVRIVILAANALLRELQLLINIALRALTSLLNGAIRALSFLIRTFLRMARRLIYIAWEFILLLADIKALPRVITNFSRFILNPVLLLLVASRTIIYVSYLVFSYFFAGGIGILFRMVIAAALAAFTFMGIIWLLTTDSTVTILPLAVVNAAAEYGTRAAVLFLVYSYTLAITARVFGFGPFKVGPATLIVTAFFAGVLILRLVVPRLRAAQ